MNDLDYCRRLAQADAYGEYLCVLMLAPAFRPRALAVLALDVELRQVAAKVGEEMIAHIRFAWWRENLVAEDMPKDHPVLRAISASQLTYAILEPMIDEAQLAWPKVSSTHAAFHAAMENLLAGDDVQLARWQKSVAVVEKNKLVWRPWLAVKLLLSR